MLPKQAVHLKLGQFYDATVILNEAKNLCILLVHGAVATVDAAFGVAMDTAIAYTTTHGGWAAWWGKMVGLMI